MRSARIDQFPEDTLAGPVSVEMDELLYLLSIEALDGVCQSALGVLIWLRRQRIVDSIGPTFFLKCVQECFLIERRPFESLGELTIDLKPACVGIPLDHWTQIAA